MTRMKSHWLKPVGAVAVAGVLLIGISTYSGMLSSRQTVHAESNDFQNNTIHVVGTGEISVKPDTAYLSIGIESQATTAKEAQSANAKKMDKINTLLKDTWAIEAKDIQTGQFYVQPSYTYTEKEGQKIKGYTAYHTLNVTYRDLDKIGQLLDSASNAGANRIDNVRFTTENPEQYEEQVIDKAMANASMKAKAIAKAANRQVGLVVSVTQSSGQASIYTNQNRVTIQSMDMAESASTPIEAGEINVKTTLNVTYQMK